MAKVLYKINRKQKACIVTPVRSGTGYEQMRNVRPIRL